MSGFHTDAFFEAISKKSTQGNQMNTHDKIELPTLPEPFTYTRPGKSEGALFHAGHMQDYALASIEPYARRIAQLEAQLEKALTERDDYHDMADQLSEQIAAITTLVGEASKPHNEPVNMLSDAEIREVFLANGFTIKDGHDDLKPYVYDAARALLARYKKRI